MLTKQEREEIAERFRNYDKAEHITLYSGMYDGLLGEHVPKETTVKKDRMELTNRILELCDTSNMLELPTDKDGEVIHIGDTVYDDDNVLHRVFQIDLKSDGWSVLASGGHLCYGQYFSPKELTHGKPATVASLVSELRHVLDKGHMSAWSMAKLFDIADQLESLGDSDAN